MKPLLNYFKIFLGTFTFCFIAKANEVFFSFSEENQQFILNPNNSAYNFNRLTLSSKGEIYLFKGALFKTEALIDTVTLNQQDQRQIVFSGQQFGLFRPHRFFDLFIGAFTLMPDGADLNNIFDVINPKDYRQPFNSRSIGSAGLLFNIPTETLNLKLFYIPQNTRSLLPDTQSAWWPRTDALPITYSNGTFNLPENMSYVKQNESEYNNPFKNNFGFTSKYSFSAFDLHLFYFNGANQVPKISPHFNIALTSLDPLVGVIQPPVEINLLWYKSEHLGAGTTMAFSDWITKIFCKKQTDYLSEKIDSTACTFSLESSLPIKRFSLYYFLQANREWMHEETSTELETLMGFFEKSSTLGFLIDTEDAGLISGAIVYNEKNPAVMTSIGYEYRFTEKLKGKISYNAIISSGGILAAAYDKTDNTALLLNYDF